VWFVILAQGQKIFQVQFHPGGVCNSPKAERSSTPAGFAILAQGRKTFQVQFPPGWGLRFSPQGRKIFQVQFHPGGVCNFHKGEKYSKCNSTPAGFVILAQGRKIFQVQFHHGGVWGLRFSPKGEKSSKCNSTPAGFAILAQRAKKLPSAFPPRWGL
jgi:hypothetical protein